MLENLDDSSSMRFQTQIIEGLTLSSKMWNGLRYVSLQKDSDFLTVPMDCWRLLALKLQEIGEKLDISEDGYMRRKLFSSKGESCTEFFVTGEDGEGKRVWASKHTFLSKSLADQEGAKWLKKSGKTGLVYQVNILQENSTPLSDSHMMKLVFINEVLKKVEVKAFGSCEGCEFSEPGQQAHMGWGACCTPEQEKVLMWMSHILCDIKPLDLSTIFDRLRSELGLRPVFSLQLAKAAICYLDNRAVAESLVTFWLEGGVEKVKNVLKDLEYRFD